MNQLLDDEEDVFDSLNRNVLDDGDKILQSLPQKSPWKDNDAPSMPGEAANGFGTQRAAWQEASTPHLFVSLGGRCSSQENLQIGWRPDTEFLTISE